MAVESVYVPENCLQGTEFPAHIIWNKDIPITVQIHLPKGIKIKEVYNVKEDGFELSENTLTINEVEVNGYVGLVFCSEIYDKPFLEEQIKFVFKIENEEEVINKKILLFRPEIQVYEKPEKIFVTFSEELSQILVSDKIRVSNKGGGTAILSIKVKEESEVVKKSPEAIEEFREGFWRDLEKRLNKLKEEFPEYSEIISGYIRLGKTPIEFDKEYLANLESVITQLYDALQSDESFLEAFAEAIVSAYLMNINIITEINSFIEYLKSITTERIIFLDAMNVIEVDSNSKNFAAEITVTDLALNEYRPIDISVEIKSNKKGKFPLYLMFEWGEAGGESVG